MAEYIEREAVMKIIDDYGCTHGGTLGSHSGAVDVIGSAIYKLPIADVAPVKHGHWVKEKPDVLIHWHCSVCKNCYYLEEPNANFCPNCGAKMFGGEEK